MRLKLHRLKPRDGWAYKQFRASVIRDRPICEHCNSRPAKIVAHRKQPLFWGGLMDKANVLALCIECDRDFTRSNPTLRRRVK